MKSTENTFASLIAIEGNLWHYHVPRFQREYVWGKNNWGKLLEDILDDEPGHYMGSVICVQQEKELCPASELIYEVVDGQQRLLTLSLLLAAIYAKLGDLADSDPALKANDDFIIRRNSIKKRLIKQVDHHSPSLPWGIFKSGSLVCCLRVQPSTQENNLDDYRYVLREAGVLPDAPCQAWVALRRVYRAFDYFRERIPGSLKEIYDLVDRIYALSFVHITETSQSKAFVIFETLNYRGVPLSAIDIIKNKMLATLEMKHNVSIDAGYEDWLKLLSYLPEDGDQDRFLRQFYNAFKFRDDIKVEKFTRAIASTAIPIYESLITKDAKHILRELVDKAQIYNQFIEPHKYPASTLTSALVDLDRMGAASSYIFLLYLFSLPDDAFVETDVKEKTVELLCKYYFRRNVTDYPNTRDLDRINVDLVETCNAEISEGRKLSYPLIAGAILRGKGRPASLERLRETLADQLFYNNENMARYSLAKLDETYHTREYAPDLWARSEKGLYIWTVEHILPQGRNLRPEWVQMIANGDREEAERIQAEWVHCLGNLTLTGYNSRLSDQPFAKKQEKTTANVFGHRLKIGYKNGLALNNIEFVVGGERTTLAKCREWTVEHVKARNEVMVDMLATLFRFEGE